MIKKIVLILISILYLSHVYADNKVLLVTLTDGVSAKFTLADKPTISFPGDSVIIASDLFYTSYLRNDVESFSFVTDNGGVTSHLKKHIDYSFIDNVFSTNEGSIYVYNISGHLVIKGNRTISLQNQANGIYIIKVNNLTIKVIRK